MQDYGAWPELQGGSLHFPGSSGEQGAHSQLWDPEVSADGHQQANRKEAEEVQQAQGSPSAPRAQHTHVHTHSQAHTHIDAHTDPSTCTRPHTLTHVHTGTDVHTCTHPCTYMHTHTGTDSHTPTHPCSIRRAAQDAQRAHLGRVGAFWHPTLRVYPFLLGLRGQGQ